MILIAVPTFENISPETFKSIYAQDTTEHTVFEFVKGYDCARARNVIAEIALQQDAEYVLMVDSDVVLPSSALRLLLENPVDIKLGVYPRKNTSTGQTEIFKLGNKDFVDANNLNMSEISKRECFDIKGGGLGCALIRTEVFKKIPQPWFKYVQYDNGALLSEDNYFCWQAAEAGCKIQVDTGVLCGHVMKEVRYG